MKKLGLFLCVVLLLLGCEKRDPALSELTDTNQEVKLSLWTSDHADFFKALGQEFFASQQVVGALEVKSFPDQPRLEEALLHALAEDRGPDLLFTSGDWVVHNPAKILAAEPFEGFDLEKLQSLWVPSAQQTFLGKDSIHGVPLGVDSLALAYHESLVNDLLGQEDLGGLTWSELPLLVSRLTQRDNSFARFSLAGIALGRVDNMSHLADVFQSILFQRDFALFTPDGKKAVLTQEGVNAEGKKYQFGPDTLQFLKSFADPTHAHFSWSQAHAQALETFQAKKLALMIVSAQDVKSLDRPGVRITFLPQFELATRKFLAEAFGLVVPRKSRQPQVAWKFLRFAHQSDIARSFHTATGLLSAQQPLLLEQEQDELTHVFARQIKTADSGTFALPKSKFRIFFEQMMQQDQSLSWLEEQLTQALE